MRWHCCYHVRYDLGAKLCPVCTRVYSAQHGPLSPVVTFLPFYLHRHTLSIKYHDHIWQMSPQLSWYSAAFFSREKFIRQLTFSSFLFVFNFYDDNMDKACHVSVSHTPKIIVILGEFSIVIHDVRSINWLVVSGRDGLIHYNIKCPMHFRYTTIVGPLRWIWMGWSSRWRLDELSMCDKLYPCRPYNSLWIIIMFILYVK